MDVKVMSFSCFFVFSRLLEGKGDGEAKVVVSAGSAP